MAITDAGCFCICVSFLTQGWGSEANLIYLHVLCFGLNLRALLEHVNWVPFGWNGTEMHPPGGWLNSWSQAKAGLESLPLLWKCPFGGYWGLSSKYLPCESAAITCKFIFQLVLQWPLKTSWLSCNTFTKPLCLICTWFCYACNMQVYFKKIRHLSFLTYKKMEDDYF